ncbi:MAG: DUF3795 domain-containing protein [Candidatus Thorarchaeota archaeon]
MKLNPCGHVCDICPSYQGKDGHHCSGCLDSKGKPWWGSCKLFECANKRRVRHCGDCTDFPCDLQIEHFDPSNPNGQRNAVMRTGVLAYWAKYGEDKTIELVKRIHGL